MYLWSTENATVGQMWQAANCSSLVKSMHTYFYMAICMLVIFHYLRMLSITD